MVEFGPNETEEEARKFADNTPEAADVIRRALDGDEDALREILKSDEEAFFVDDMPGALEKFDRNQS